MELVVGSESNVDFDTCSNITLKRMEIEMLTILIGLILLALSVICRGRIGVGFLVFAICYLFVGVSLYLCNESDDRGKCTCRIEKEVKP